MRLTTKGEVMNFFARHGFVIIILLSVIIFGTLMFDVASPLVNELHHTLSPESPTTSPQPTIA